MRQLEIPPPSTHASGGRRRPLDSAVAEQHRARRWPATLIGALSVASGLAMLVAPSGLARSYALPRRSLFVRLLGLRDIAIGLQIVGSDPEVGLRARMLSDLGDFGLILATHASRARARKVSGRLAGALASAVLAGALQRNRRAPTR